MTLIFGRIWFRDFVILHKFNFNYHVVDRHGLPAKPDKLEQYKYVARSVLVVDESMRAVGDQQARDEDSREEPERSGT